MNKFYQGFMSFWNLLFTKTTDSFELGIIFAIICFLIGIGVFAGFMTSRIVKLIIKNVENNNV